MSVLRSTDHDMASAGFEVSMSLAHLDERNVEMFYSWIEIWLHKNCKAGWHMETQERSVRSQTTPATYLVISFDDAREAIYFKLSPEYMRGQIAPLTHFCVNGLVARCA